MCNVRCSKFTTFVHDDRMVSADNRDIQRLASEDRHIQQSKNELDKSKIFDVKHHVLMCLFDLLGLLVSLR